MFDLDYISGWTLNRVFAGLARIMPGRFGVTVVVTSCDRPDLLDKTLSSFFKLNTFPITRMIIVEDGGKIESDLVEKYQSRNIDWISTGDRVGQIAAIDYAYSHINTHFVFHMEDDWEFYEPDFIEKSIRILRSNPKCLQLWLRSLEDTNNHPVDSQVHLKGDIKWQKLAWDYQNKWGEWHGFSFNPGLRRFADYRLTGGYGKLAKYDFNNPGKAESIIGKYYREHEYFAGILADNGGLGYVRHLGGGRQVTRFVEVSKRKR